MPHQHLKPKQASAHTILVYEEDGQFCQYAGAGKHPVCVYDRERAVLESARRVGESFNADLVRVVFVLPLQGQQPPHPSVKP